MEQVEKKKGFSWMGLLFGGMYYAGYGQLVKGLVMGVLSFIPLTMIIVNIYAGIKAKAELPVGERPFNWGNALVVLVVGCAVSGLFLYVVRGGF